MRDEGEVTPGAARPEMAADMILNLVDHLDAELAAPQHTPGAGPPERFLNSQSPYLDGYVAASLALGAANEASARSIKEQLRAFLCSGASPEHTIVLLRLMTRVPEFATADGIDCALSSQSTEGPVLWEAIDAWQKAELPESEEVAHWRSRGSDQRTLRRFERNTEESQERQ